MFSSFPFESAHHNLIRKTSKALSPLQLTEVVAKRFLRDFFRTRVPKIATNDLKFGSLVLISFKTVYYLEPEHPFFDAERSLIKTTKNFSFNKSNYHCYNESCSFKDTGSCPHFVKYCVEGQEKFGMLTDIHFDISESSAVVSLQEFAYEHCDFANGVTNEDLRLAINKFNELGPLSYIVRLTEKLNCDYLYLKQLLSPCVTYRQCSETFCFSLCQIMEHN